MLSYGDGVLCKRVKGAHSDMLCMALTVAVIVMLAMLAQKRCVFGPSLIVKVVVVFEKKEVSMRKALLCYSIYLYCYYIQCVFPVLL
jgi:hypothetical protein